MIGDDRGTLQTTIMVRQSNRVLIYNCVTYLAGGIDLGLQREGKSKRWRSKEAIRSEETIFRTEGVVGPTCGLRTRVYTNNNT